MAIRLDFLRRNKAAMTKRPASAPVMPIFNVAPPNDAGDPAEILFYGDIVEKWPTDWWTGEKLSGNYIALDDVLDQLETVRDAPELVIRMNSSGGDLISGVTICNLLRTFKGKKTCIVEGLAASAASVILCAADSVKVHPGSWIMIHNVSSFLFGYYNSSMLNEVLETYAAGELSAKRIYAEKTGKSEEELQEMMDKTTWLVGQDAVDEGFADEVIEKAADDGDGEDIPDEDDDPERDDDDPFAVSPGGLAVTNDGRYLMVAGVRHDIAALGGLPPCLAQPNQISNAATAAKRYIVDGAGDRSGTEKELDVEIKNEAELRQHYPDLVAAVEATAVSGERQRVREIMDIAPAIADRSLVDQALYETSMTAAELTLENTRRSMQQGVNFLNALEEDSDESNTEDVDVKPTNAAEDQEDVERDNEAKTQAMLDRVIDKVNGKGRIQ